MKPGYKTTELLLTVAVIALNSLDAIPQHAQPLAIVAAIGYALARGLAKLGHGIAVDQGIDIDGFNLDDFPDPIAEQPPEPEPRHAGAVHQAPPESPPAVS